MQSVSLRRPRALLVDDDPFVRHVLSALLDEHGVECVHAVDGRDALRLLAEELLSLDLLVTDVEMPNLRGDALLLAVRELGGERDLPILVTSGHVGPEHCEALRIAGADVVIDKAFGLSAVVTAARSLLEARGHFRPSEPALEPAPVARIGLTRRRG